MRRRSRPARQLGDTERMWVHLQRQDFYEGLEPLPNAGTLLTDEGVYALVRSRVRLRERDGVELISGRAPLDRQRAPYWVTGVVGRRPRVRRRS